MNEILIIGGGLVGASAAIALLLEGFSVTLLDKDKSPSLTTQQEFNAKALALSESSLEYLNHLQILPHLKSALSPIETIHISEQGKFGVTQLHAKKYKLEALGAVVDANLLNYVLNQQLDGALNSSNQSNSLSLFREDSPHSIHWNGSEWEILTTKNRTLSASFIIAADGSESFLRNYFNIETQRKNYHHSAIVVNVGLSQSHQSIAYEKFLEEGSLAFLPFGEQRVKCVWILPTEKVQALMLLSKIEFLKSLQNEFGFYLGYFKQLGKRIVFPLQEVVSEQLGGLGFAIIGNAAQSLHPVAAQGFNLGLRDVVTLTKYLKQARAANQALTSPDIIRRYTTERMEDRNKILAFTNSLVEGGIKRRLGILATESLPFVKDAIAKLGMGT